MAKAHSVLRWKASPRVCRSYFDFINPEKPLDLKPGFDLQDELAPLLGLLKKTHDIRLLVAAARLCILGGDLAGFADAISAIARLLAAVWLDVHPRAIDDDYTERESHLSLLTDRATVLFPLQFAPLDVSRRHGPISYRSQMLATNLAPPRAKEAVLDEATIRDTLLNSDNFKDLKEKHATFGAIEADLQAIRSAFIEQVSHEAAPEFGDLFDTIKPIRAFLHSIIGEREPGAVPAEETVGEAGMPADEAAPAAPKVAAFASVAEAEASLAAIEAYSAPTSPGTRRPLVPQAQQLVGKSFIEAMLMVSPAMAEQAAHKDRRRQGAGHFGGPDEDSGRAGHQGTHPGHGGAAGNRHARRGAGANGGGEVLLPAQRAVEPHPDAAGARPLLFRPRLRSADEGNAAGEGLGAACLGTT